MQERLETVAKDACTKCGVGLYDVDLIHTQHGKIFCVFITKVDGVNITDCTKVSKEMNIFLDSDTSLIDGPYTLEVSSPGVERPLRLKKHYMSAINELIKITFLNNDKKETITGKLSEVHHDFIIIKNDDDKHQIPFHNIKKAKTCYQKLNKEN